jgi:hypothetical protein
MTGAPVLDFALLCVREVWKRDTFQLLKGPRLKKDGRAGFCRNDGAPEAPQKLALMEGVARQAHAVAAINAVRRAVTMLRNTQVKSLEGSL